jgi:ADP-ribosylglycohydrolase
MLGAFAGDMIGSLYERRGIKTTDFPLFQEPSTFTDDTVLTAAVAHAVLHDLDYGAAIRDFGRRYPRRGYGGNFRRWLWQEDSSPYNSWGNGSAMRVGPVGYAFDSTSRVLEEAKRSAEITHNHPEGIKGARATALAIFLAREGYPKTEIREEISQRFGYKLSRTVQEIRPVYSFDVSCMGTVPEAIIAFLDSCDLEDALRLAVSLGGDSDTLACITGSIAEAFYREVPQEIEREVRTRLPREFIEIMDCFYERFIPW